MGFIKHVGKHGDRKVAVVYRTVPGEEHMALVIYPDTLSKPFHDSVMKIIESEVGQSEESLADAMHRSLLADGRPMLQTLHQEGKIKKVQTSQIVITPNATSHVRLDELNKIFDGMEAGGDAAKNMAELDASAGLVDPVEQRRDAEALANLSDAPAMDSKIAGDVLGDVLSDEKLAADMMTQASQMAGEAKALVTESKRLEKEAIALNPALKPKRTVKKKAVAKKASQK